MLNDKELTNVVGIYHNADLDGIASGAILKKAYPKIQLIGYDYGDDFDFEALRDKIVFMADVSFPMDKMLEISKLAKEFTWIDHHKSAIEEYEKIKDTAEFTVYLNTAYSACAGVWYMLHPDWELPEAIRMLSEYDIWNNKHKDSWEKIVLPFQFGLRVRCTSVDTFPYELIGTDYVVRGIGLIEEIIAEGKVILKYQAQVNERLCKAAAHELNFQGYEAICLNGGGFNSQVFDSVYDPCRHDIMLMYQYTKDRLKVSLYTTKDEIDCSEIAKRFGGGGHKKASGFVCMDSSPLYKYFGGFAQAVKAIKEFDFEACIMTQPLKDPNLTNECFCDESDDSPKREVSVERYQFLDDHDSPEIRSIVNDIRGIVAKLFIDITFELVTTDSMVAFAAKARDAINAMGGLSGLIDIEVICDSSINTPETIIKGELHLHVKVGSPKLFLKFCLSPSTPQL